MKRRAIRQERAGVEITPRVGVRIETKRRPTATRRG